MLVLPILLCFTAGAFAQSSSYASSSSSSSAHASASSGPAYVYPPVTTDGPCPYIVGQTPDFERMAGPWYETRRSANNYDGMDSCTRFVWHPQPQNNSAILIYNALSGLYDMTSKTISVAVPTNEGIAITYHVPTLGNTVRNRIFLDVNYDDHVILYTCEEMGNQHLETAWVHSRQRTSGPRMDAIFRDAFARYNLNVPAMYYQDNSACDYDSYDVTCA